MGHIRYTCNKKNEPTLEEDCKRCPEYNPCAKDGKWCFVGALVLENRRVSASAMQPATIGMAAPAMVNNDYRNIMIAENMTVTIDLEEIKETLRKDMMPKFLQYGG